MRRDKRAVKSLTIPVLDVEGKISGEEKVSFSSPITLASPRLIAQAVRVFLSNQRKARPKTKTRAEVEGSKSKIWRQKGTGRARHGDKQAPIFVGGGIAHGPRGTQNYQRKLNKKMRQRIIYSLLLDKVIKNHIFLLKGLDFKKTKEAFLYLEKLKENLKVTKGVSFLVGKDDKWKRFLSNLEAVSLIYINSLDSYHLLKNDFLFLAESGFKELVSYFQLAENL